jgi:hypothetical protein
MKMPATLGFENVMTEIDSIPYPHGVTTTFNIPMNPSGNGSFVLSYSGDNSQPFNTIGQVIHMFRIVSSSLGATISPLAFRSVRANNAKGGPGNRTYIGLSGITATTSGDSCNNFSPQTIYKSNSTVLSIGTRIFSGTTGSSPVNGNNNWICLALSPTPTQQTITGVLLYSSKTAVQIDTSGFIIGINPC